MPGITAPLLRISRVANLSHNRPNQPSRKFHWVACPAGVEPATYGREGLANLQDTIFDNGVSSPDLGVRQNKGRRGAGWGLILRAWYLQARVGKTDKFERPFKGRLCLL